MTTPIPPTNMTTAEVIPDTLNPTHDPRFWCLPPMRGGHTDGRFPMYLVTQGRIVGVWKSWTVTKAMVDGYPGGAQCGHHSEASCIAEWQLHCALGVHPHPADPNLTGGSSAPAAPPPYSPASPAAHSPAASPPASPSSTRPPSPNGFTSSMSSTWEAVPCGAQYYALWQQRIVYGDRSEAQRAFMVAQARRGRQQILSTDLLEEARSFSEGAHWIAD